jgi:hypothetical protein
MTHGQTGDEGTYPLHLQGRGDILRMHKES